MSTSVLAFNTFKCNQFPSLYSGFDEIAQPEGENKRFSVFNNPRNVCVTNNKVQDICPN